MSTTVDYYDVQRMVGEAESRLRARIADLEREQTALRDELRDEVMARQSLDDRVAELEHL